MRLVPVLALVVGLCASRLAAEPALIPTPAELVARPGAFALASAHRIRLVPDEPPLRAAAESLASVLATRGTTLPVVTSNPPAPGEFVFEKADPKQALGDEGYSLAISPERVTISATGPAGYFYGVQTLDQLFAEGSLPALALTDRPRFAWRGLMVDVARRARSAAWLNRLIDVMAHYKLNVLHWHLTDDQAWRLPSARFHELGQVRGTWDPAGAYTPAEVAALVAHAAARHIRLIPEIDVPGHVSAAVAAYPDLSCRAVKIPVPSTWGTFDDVLCPGSEAPFVFLAGVLDEVAAAFPAPLVHLGGDEVPRTRWNACPRCQARITNEHLRGTDELQSYFLNRAQGLLAARGRRAIVWDDDRVHGFPPGTVVQVWHPEALADVLNAGHDVIASPASNVYLDRSSLALPLARVLAFDPVPAAATPEQARRVLGGEAALWSEFIADDGAAERALFPRLMAVAETVWATHPERDAAAFATRLAPHSAWLKRLGFAQGDQGRRIAILTPRQLAGDWRQVKIDVTPYVDGPGIYAFALGEDSPVPVEVLGMFLKEGGTQVAQILRETSTIREISERVYDLTVRGMRPGGKWTLELVVRCRGSRASMAGVWLEKRPLQ